MKAWLELFRISNLPTVWTNVGAGIAMGWHLSPNRDGSTGDTVLAILLTLIAASCLYSGGMVLNDALDLKIDREERPGRPIPSGRISSSSAFRMATVLMLGGVGLAAQAGRGGFLLPVIAVLIVILSVLYNLLHARTGWSVLLVAACRGLLYPLGAFSLHPSPDGRLDGLGVLLLGMVALVATLHTIALSLVARTEVGPASHRNLLYGLGTFSLAAPGLFLACALLLLYGSEYGEHAWPFPGVAILVAITLLITWLVRNYRLLQLEPPRVTGFVLGSIAAFPLFDALFLAMLPGFWALLALLGLMVFVIVRKMHRRIPGT
ncbi:MAG: UbiA family prenyltransferase [Phycisphaerales bacterium]|nr:UbiA family prenyltransferase [Phycisphaerales bacterium]